ncbi:MAG TPA: hypothetical protein VHL80_13880, partial [Polyangia bacterium]|nr:hypothetical protein [Polyangia bacterium]
GATDGGASGAGAADAAGPPSTFASGVRVHLQRTFAAPKVISFGLPLPPGAVADAGTLRVAMGGAPVAANVKALLAVHDAAGAPQGVRAVLVQLPATILAGDAADVDVAWSGPGSAPGVASSTFASADVSADSPEVVTTTVRTITAAGGVNALVDGPHVDQTLFTGKEPRVLATFPDGYLAATGLLGPQVTRGGLLGGDYAGLAFMSDNLQKFGASAMYAEAYALNPDGVVDPVANYEGWLYDRCATFLTFYSHTGDARFLRHAYRSCSYYAGKIGLAGATAGIFTGKPDVDQKYSHLRGLYAYYALTGDEGALAAGTAIAQMWRDDTLFVGPYRMGHLRGPDKLWTERLLGTSLEGLYYGHRLTGDTTYLDAFKQMIDTAYRHVTGDAAALALINPGVGPFPPQSCFIHSALQHSEGDATEPWCSTWMSELTIDALLQYQAQTGDVRVDEIFVRLVRFLRDVGSQYVTADALDDRFLAPKACYDPKASDLRRLVPIYGSGLTEDGTRDNFGASDDNEHCTDATALTAAGIRALVRQGKFAAAPASPSLAPFKTEGESFLAMHNEFAACASATFADDSRPRRDPAAWTSAELAAGLADPAGFIADNLIGYPKFPTSPQRKLSWWFNMSMLQFGLLADAGVKLQALAPGQVQPATCP